MAWAPSSKSPAWSAGTTVWLPTLSITASTTSPSREPRRFSFSTTSPAAGRGPASPAPRLIGLASTGLHTNGYSLARKLLFEVAGYQPDTFLPELNSKLGDKLLQPHQCYYLLMKPLLERGWLSAG